MDSRERITAILNLEEPDRVGYQDGPWRETVDRWEAEGMPKGVFLQEYLGMDMYGVGADQSPKYDGITYEEAMEWRIARDSWGVKSKYWRDRSGVPFPMEPVVTNLEDFKERIEPLLDPKAPMRISSPRYPFKADIEKNIKGFQKRFFVTTGALGPYECMRHMFGGHANLLLHMMRNVDSATYMFNYLADYASKIVEGFIEAGVDGLFFPDDVAYKNGPFFSPAVYRKVVLPAHTKICVPFRKRGLPTILHTDGNVKPLIPSFIEAGITALQPLEAKAGMDVRELKELYGDKLAFMGNIDVRTLSSDDPEAMKQEVLSKLSVAAQGGGYIIGSDHSVPPTVSLKSYQNFLRTARKYGSYPLKGP